MEAKVSRLSGLFIVAYGTVPAASVPVYASCLGEGGILHCMRRVFPRRRGGICCGTLRHL
jgi:hypothetical protein